MLFDAHADILTDLYQQHKKGHDQSFRSRHVEHYKKAGITHSIFVNWTNPDTTNDHQFQEIFENAFTELDAMSDIFHIVKHHKDMKESIQQNKIGVIIGMEGIAQLRDVSHLRELYDKGVRHASLTWNEVNRYAGGLSSNTEGLTLLGKEILSEMESLGMIIDLAHTNPVTFDQVLDNTKNPVIISHGNCKALCPHIRNYTDEQLIKIKERNGVIGICGIANFIAEDKTNQTVTMMANHIDYAVKLIGIDHVGVGFDVCYYLGDSVDSNRVEGFQTIADAPNVFIELKKLGYTDTDIQKIQYDNFARIVKEILR